MINALVKAINRKLKYVDRFCVLQIVEIYGNISMINRFQTEGRRP